MLQISPQPDVRKTAAASPGKDFEIIATIHSSNLDHAYLRKLVNNGATFLRLNGSFINPDEFEKIVDVIREYAGPDIKIIVDLPGYKLRFMHLDHDVHFKKNIPFMLERRVFNYPDFIDRISIGEVIRLNDGMDEFVVLEACHEFILCVSKKDGVIRKGKGLHPDKTGFRPSSNSLSDLDLLLIRKVQNCAVDFVGLSFVHNYDDVAYVQNLLKGSTVQCIPKIEAKQSIDNLYGILKNSSLVIVDRGDLSGEIGLQNIWAKQREILSMARFCNTRVIIATQFMSTMMTNPIPSVAEVDSLYSLLDFGIDGIQFSDETCVGDYGAEAVQFVRDCRETHSGKRSMAEAGPVIWMMGPSAAGKTTIAEQVVKRLAAEQITAFHYDGDEVRNMLGPDLGFSGKDRLSVVKALVYLALKTSRMGFPVVVSALTAHEDSRDYIRKTIDRLVLVYTDCSLNECIRRDPKGIYKRAMSGEIDTVIGYNSPYVKPETVNLTVHSDHISPIENAGHIVTYLMENRIVP